MQNIRFPADCKAIIDVTKPPYNCDNTGREDCTKAICRAIDDVLGAYLKNFNETAEKLQNDPDPYALYSFEIRKIDGVPNVVFPEKLPDSRIIYFPRGTYLVSDTLSYSFEEFRNILFGVRNLEMDCCLRFLGEDRDGTIIKLKDNCKGFEHGQDRPVISFMQGEASNIAQTNMIENITIDVGSGNPGATGIRYFANNTGAVRDVKIISTDKERRGNTGFSVLHDKVSACYAKNLYIEGFDFGVRIEPQTHFTVFEHITLKHQKRVGFTVGNTIVSIKDLKSENEVPALRIYGVAAVVTLLDAELRGGSHLQPAVKYMFGHCFLRNVKSYGYKTVLEATFPNNRYPCFDNKDYIDEFCSSGPYTLFPNDTKSLNIEVPETPECKWDDPKDWVSVNEFGARGDGVTDDTEAVRRAMASGKSTVYFQPGRYLLDGVIEVPSHVNRINFMYGDLISGPNLTAMKGKGTFLVNGESDVPLIIEDLYAFEKFFGYMTFIEHACRRTLVISDVHVQCAALYFNTIEGGRVFMENAGCTIGGIPGAAVRPKMPGEEKFPYDREMPCFYFKGQQVYCRQVNPERSRHEVINDGGTLFVMGFKTEEEGTPFETRNGGRTEIYGGTFCIGLNFPDPVIINDESDCSVFSTTMLYGPQQDFPVAVKEIRNGSTKFIYRNEMPIRFMHSYLVPMYVGKRNK